MDLPHRRMHPPPPPPPPPPHSRENAKISNFGQILGQYSGKIRVEFGQRFGQDHFYYSGMVRDSGNMGKKFVCAPEMDRSYTPMAYPVMLTRI